VQAPIWQGDAAAAHKKSTGGLFCEQRGYQKENAISPNNNDHRSTRFRVCEL
jgi:hypothetical protein